MRTNDQVMQGVKLMVKWFQKSSQVSFLLIDPDLGNWYIIWKTRGLNLKNTCKLRLWNWGFHVKPLFFKKKSLVVTCSLMSWLQGSFGFTYLWARPKEKRVEELHSESKGSWLKPRLSVTLESNKYQTQWLRSG